AAATGGRLAVPGPPAALGRAARPGVAGAVRRLPHGLARRPGGRPGRPPGRRLAGAGRRPAARGPRAARLGGFVRTGAAAEPAARARPPRPRRRLGPARPGDRPRRVLLPPARPLAPGPARPRARATLRRGRDPPRRRPAGAGRRAVRF